MNTHTIILHTTWRSLFLNTMAQLSQGLVSAWTRLREERDCRLTLDAAADLDDETLHDIGAPDWLVSRAEARRDARAGERIALRFSRQSW